MPVRVLHAHSTGKKASSLRGGLALVAHSLNRHRVASYATDCFACSAQAADWFGFGSLSSGWRLVKNGIDIDRFCFDASKRDSCRREFGIGDDVFVLGSIGRLTPQKNQTYLLDVFAELLRMRPQSLLLLVGDGELEAELIHKAELLGVRGSMIHLKNRADTERLYCAMDAFVLTSTNEGLGIVNIEAQTNGLSCFVSDGVPDEAFVSDSVRRLSLAVSPSVWAKAIGRTEVGARNPGGPGQVKAAGYDIAETASWLESFYLGS